MRSIGKNKPSLRAYERGKKIRDPLRKEDLPLRSIHRVPMAGRWKAAKHPSKGFHRPTCKSFTSDFIGRTARLWLLSETFPRMKSSRPSVSLYARGRKANRVASPLCP